MTKPSEWRRRRADILARLQLVMGPLPEESRRVPLDLRVLEEERLTKFTRQKVTFAVEGRDRVPAWLLIPNGLKRKAPAMLCLHQTTRIGKDSRPVWAVAAWSEVARRIAHEIKNPLTPIQLSAQRLRKRYLDKLPEDGAVFDECTKTLVKQVGS